MISPDEMQKYAEDLVVFSQSQSAPVAVPPAPPPAPPGNSAAALPPAPADSAHLKTPHVRPAGAYRKESFASTNTDDTTETETDFGDAETSASTDDEPTIRPTRSYAGSETQSLYSTETEDEDERERDMEDA
jgi:PHO85 cyclin-6/7